MNINGLLNLHRFELFLQALSEKELDHFEDIYSDAKWLEGKTSKKVQGFKNKVVTDTPGPAHVEEMLYENTAGPSPSLEGEGWEVVSNQHKKDSDFMRLLKSADDFLLDSSDDTVDLDSSDTDLSAFDHPSDPNGEPRDSNYHIEFRQHKREYYIRKLGYANVTADVLKEQAYGYVRAIQWNLHYYYNGCVSWAWYYQHHYGKNDLYFCKYFICFLIKSRPKKFVKSKFFLAKFRFLLFQNWPKINLLTRKKVKN